MSHKCQKCGKGPKAADGGLSEHHVYPQRHHDHWDKKHVPVNRTETLCRTPCHDTADRIIRFIEQRGRERLPLKPFRYRIAYELFVDAI